MHTLSRKNELSRRTWVATGTIALAALFSASVAFAECDEDDENMAAKAIATAAAAKVAPAIPGAGKQMLDLDKCNYGAGAVETDFKLNILGSDGLYWAQGKAKVKGSTVSDLKFTTLSPNLATASSAKGIKLASN